MERRGVDARNPHTPFQLPSDTVRKSKHDAIHKLVYNSCAVVFNECSRCYARARRRLLTDICNSALSLVMRCALSDLARLMRAALSFSWHACGDHHQTRAGFMRSLVHSLTHSLFCAPPFTRDYGVYGFTKYCIFYKLRGGGGKGPDCIRTCRLQGVRRPKSQREDFS